ncbi:hypothetical protein [Streptococcus suis]|uniref:hypothetical protein n=1 Tax=Streptococcus suis TaxID=1307 RepID=UPI0021184B5F|nr:hypothetical protein [Streptococcus suis]MCQ8272107.1 hypothetical protein [Streptococcus suis]MDY7601217.1 hypothetical protein [Streptococcus suis]UUM48686.1 hypothetical protein NQZ97_07615 [Streptococcus suis]HEL1770543.1 hypothetical protein [Streptococcus suis]HEL1783513.1 hypothetical protein [Streptococcus suis]
MKKIIICITLLSCLVFPFIGWKLYAYQHNKISLTENADFYLVYPDKVEAFQLNGQEPELLHTQKMNSEGYFGSGENYILEDRYLVFGNDHQKFIHDNLISIDFQDGTVLRKPSKHSTSISGTDGQSFYTAGAYHHLVQFDKQFEATQTLALNDDFILHAPVYVDDTSVYLTGVVRELNQDGTEENVLIVFDKKDFSKQEVFKYDNSIATGDGLLVNRTIYLTIWGKKAPEYEDGQVPNELLTFDTRSKTFSSIKLEHPSPSTLHALKDENLLLIEHQNGMFSPLSFTIYNTQTGEQSYHTLKNLNPRPHYIDHIRQIDDKRLMIILANQLLIYDMEAKSIISQTTLSEDYVSGVWINP